jgi:UDP-glucose 4-epimerase
MKILVTGGSGFIGSYLVEKLLTESHEVIVLDNFVTSNIENLGSVIDNSKLKIINGSILDESLISSTLKKVDYVFHLAAAVGVMNIVNNPLNSIRVNILGTHNVLHFASKHGTPIFLASSSEVYGKNSQSKLSEDSDRILGSPQILRWSYSEAKAIDESLAMAYWVEEKLPIRITRFFNTVGPRQLGNYGMVIPRFISAALKNEPIKIFGSGDQTRCFVHVSDVIDAIQLIAFNSSCIGNVYNIGNPHEISIKDLALRIKLLSNSKSSILFEDYEGGYGVGFEDMDRRFPDITKISQLGWYPKKDLNFILNELINTHKNLVL